MPIDPGPHDLGRVRMILGPRAQATLKVATPTFFEELDAEFDGFARHLLICRFDFDKPWSTWEIHPRGDEFVYLLSGDVEFVLWLDGRERTVRVDNPGRYVVVPRGTWHTARPRAPTSMLFVTPGEGTRNSETPG
jgi:quercetin dioxygenase-like cupin family protein